MINFKMKIKRISAIIIALCIIVVSSPITVNADDNNNAKIFWTSFGVDVNNLTPEENAKLENAFKSRNFNLVKSINKYTVSEEIINKHLSQAANIQDTNEDGFMLKWFKRNENITTGAIQNNIGETNKNPSINSMSLFNVPPTSEVPSQPSQQDPVQSTAPLSEAINATEEGQTKDLMNDIEKYIEDGQLDMTFLAIMKYIVIVDKSTGRFSSNDEKAAEYTKIIKLLQSKQAKLQEKMSSFGLEMFAVEPINYANTTQDQRAYQREMNERAKFFQDSLKTDFTSLYYSVEEQKSVDKDIKYQPFEINKINDYYRAYYKALGFTEDLYFFPNPIEHTIKKEAMDDLSEHAKLRNSLAYTAALYSSPVAVPMAVMDYSKIKDETLSENNVQELFQKAFNQRVQMPLEKIGLMNFYINYIEEMAEAQKALGIFVEDDSSIQGASFAIKFQGDKVSKEAIDNKIKWLKRVLELLKVDMQSKLQQTSTEESALSSKDALSNLVYQDRSTGSKILLRPNVLHGIALSSLYQPLETNAFNNQHLKQIVSTEFFKFHSNYGRMVKHLMISSNSKSASRYYATESVGNFRVAKLKDLINNVEQEKVLVVAENYYDKNNIVIDSLKDEDKNAFKTWSEDNFQLNHTSSSNAKKVVKAFDKSLSEQDYLNYTNLLGLKIAKSLLEDVIETEGNILEAQKPIFISTKTINGVNDKKAYFNYLLLKGIKERVKANYRLVLDLEAPIFSDIYGNIITESGLVIVPSAANATLNAKYNFLTVAWLSNCTSVKFPEKLEFEAHALNNITDWVKFEERVNEAKIMVPQLDKDQNIIKETYEPNSLVVFLDSQTLNLSSIDLMSDITARIIFNLNKELIKGQNQFKTSYWTRSIMYPVTKGAYPELVNYEEENLNFLDGETKLGLTQALKLERLIDSMNKTIQNTLFTIPDVRFVPGFEMIYFNSMRILVIISTLVLIFEIYYFTLKRKITVLSMIQFLVTAVIIVTLFFLLPKAYSISYNSQKYLLQNSLLRIATLNNEKAKNEVEIGVVDGRDPTENPSRIFIKIGEDKINFYSIVRNMMLNEINERKDKTYQDESSNTRVGITNDYVQYANMKFFDVQELFDSSIIATDTSTGIMQQYIKEDPAASFYLPYYAFIDYIIHNVNTYNAMIEKNTGSFQVMNDGTVRSVGLVTDYFKSDAFLLTNADMRDPKYEPPLAVDDRVLVLAGYDKLGINQIYNVQAADNRTIFPEKLSFKSSGWYIQDMEINKKYQHKVDLMDKSAVAYIVENNKMLGKLTDETIIKSLALAMSLKYNRTFFTGSPQYLEMMQISTYDALRVMITDFNETTLYAPYSYAYMVYKTTGTVGVYIAVFLELVTRALSYIKPGVSLLLMMIFIIALTFNRVIAKERNFDLVKGYIKAVVILVALNFLYAAGLALSQVFSQMGTSSLLCLIFVFIVNFGYMMALLSVTAIIVMNYKDLGNQAFNDSFNKSLTKMSNFSSLIHQVQVVGTSPKDRMRKTVRQYYEDLRRRQASYKNQEASEGIFQRTRSNKGKEDSVRKHDYTTPETRQQTEQATERLRRTNNGDFEK